MKLVTIESFEDVVGKQHIKTGEGVRFVNSLIKNHPLAVVDILNEEGWDGLVHLVIERENKYHKAIKENPNDLDTAIDALYGEFKYDSALDKQIEELEEAIYQLTEEQYSHSRTDDFKNYLNEAELELDEDEQVALYDKRTKEKWRELEKKKLEKQIGLDNLTEFKEALFPLKLDFSPRASEVLLSYSTDDIVFSL
ncbi:hypothetical protein ACFSKU_08925 [Pontibacter silvestris]|uniref:Uncharacterized protein n=1 Tax=Pontibacter silvestris TaxID=2305183 RepID=A0ABW4WZ96_9BACT|nr:hypothetical protein [Pontibacter silvestris]MCC9138867.1 hypothetical protein [Pontibacter silvestris]